MMEVMAAGACGAQACQAANNCAARDGGNFQLTPNTTAVASLNTPILNSVATPKLPPPPPRLAQNRSGSDEALACSVRAWLSTIAHNLAVDVLRARTSAPVDPQDLPALLTAMTDTPERFAVAHDNAAGLRRALAALPAGQARAVAMAGIYGMTARQISEAEGVPLGTAKTRIRDGMEKLRSAYLREDVGDD